MQKQKAIVVDCDEVLLDHLGGLREYVKTKHGIITTTDYPVEYGLEKWLNMNQEEVMAILKEFNEQSAEFGMLEKIPSADLVTALRFTYQDAHMVVLTKSGTGGHGEVLRRCNIHHCFPNVFDEVIIVEMNESKHDALVELQKKYDVRCLVDDYIINIDTAIELGIHGIMLSRPHNQEYKDSTDFHFTGTWAGVLHNIILEMNKGE